LLEAGYNEVMKPSNKTVDDFIKLPHENAIKKFFMEDIDQLLANYAPGEPKMKPDVLKQIDEIMEERKKQLLEEQGKAQKVFMQGADGKQVELSAQQIIEIIQGQQTQIIALQSRVKLLENIVIGCPQCIVKLGDS
jgi:hypothetical protein